MQATTHTISVLVTRAKDLPGVWVSHCLNLDVISQGESIRGALEAIEEAVLMVLNEDESEGLDPFDRERAPDEYWDEMSRIMREGVSVQAVTDENQICAVVTQLRFVRIPAAAIERMPEAWQIAAIRRDGDHGYCDC